MDNAQKYYVSDLGKCKVNPVEGDRQIDAKWRDDKYDVESSRSRWNIDNCGRNQNNSDFADGH